MTDALIAEAEQFAAEIKGASPKTRVVGLDYFRPTTFY
jgi:hypothetical protein